MNRKQMVTLVGCILAVLLIGLSIVMPTLRLHVNTDIYIFEDISECEALASLKTEGGNFTKYQDTKLDGNLNNLQYSKFFAGKYSCAQYNFEIFAYAFDDSASAKTYFKNATGKDSTALDANFSIVSGIMTSHIIVLKGNTAYAVYCPSTDLADVSMILADCFEIRLR